MALSCVLSELEPDLLMKIQTINTTINITTIQKIYIANSIVFITHLSHLITINSYFLTSMN